MGKLPTCCGLVIDTANKSVTSRCNGIWETTRHNRQNGLLLAPTCSGFIVYVTDLLRTCYREAGVMDFGFNCQKLYVHIIMSFVEFHYFQGWKILRYFWNCCKYEKCRVFDIFKILPPYNLRCSFNHVYRANSVFNDYYQLFWLHLNTEHWVYCTLAAG